MSFKFAYRSPFVHTCSQFWYLTATRNHKVQAIRKIFSAHAQSEFYVSTEFHCSALAMHCITDVRCTTVWRDPQKAQQISVRMRNRNFGVSNEPIKRHCDSSSTTKFELARLLPLAVPITNGRTDGRTHIRKLIEGKIRFIYMIIFGIFNKGSEHTMQ